MAGSRARVGCIALLCCLPFALYARNLDDYFIGDDFDLIASFHGKPAGYFVALLWSNESGDVWRDTGLDPARGRGYLRPVKIWSLALDSQLFGTNPIGYHVTSTLLACALVSVVFCLLDLLLPGRRHYALLGASVIAIHPVLGEIVPFISGREETLAALFGSAALYAFVRFRLRGGSPLAYYALYVLALLSKESAVAVAAIAIGYDWAHGHVGLRTPEGRRAALATHGPLLAVGAVYLLLRWIAFGNVVGGDSGDSGFLSPRAWLHFHAGFFRSLVAPAQLGLPWPRAVGAACLAAAVAGCVFVWLRADRRHYLPLLLFTGPFWYAGSTALYYGTYFDVRHHALPITGLVLFASVLLAAVSERVPIGGQRAIAAAIFAVCAVAFVPPSRALSRTFDAASGVVERVRRTIEVQTAHLPDGCSVRIRNVPQQTERPWYFGWGLLNALRRPFTESDLASRCVVVNRRNLALTHARMEIPERFDLTLDLRVVPSGVPPAPPRTR